MPATPDGTVVVLPDGRPVVRRRKSCLCCSRCWCWCGGAVLPTTLHAHLTATFTPPWVCGDCADVPPYGGGDANCAGVFDLDISYDITAGSTLAACEAYSGPTYDSFPLADRTGPVCVTYYYGLPFQTLCIRVQTLTFQNEHSASSWGSGLTSLCDHVTEFGHYSARSTAPIWFTTRPNGAWVIKRDVTSPPGDCPAPPPGETVTGWDYLACCGGDPALPLLGDSKYLQWIVDASPHTWSCGGGHFTASFHVRDGFGTVIGSYDLTD